MRDIKLEETNLENGFKIFTDKVSCFETMSIALYITSGSLDEGKDERGAAHFLEHIVFNGTQNRTKERILRETSLIGSGGNASTCLEHTTFSAYVLQKDFEKILELFSDYVRNPKLEESEIEREKNVVYDEIRRYDDSPGSVLTDGMDQQMHRSKFFDVTGTKEDVQKLNFGKIKSFLDRNYIPSNMFLVVSGPIEHKDVVEYVKKHFGDMPSKPAKSPRAPQEYFPSQFMKINESLTQDYFQLVFQSLVPSLHTKERAALLALSSILGSGMFSRLHRKIRMERGLTYSSDSCIVRRESFHLLYIDISTEHEKIREIISLVLEELNNIKLHGVDKDELDIVVDQWKRNVVIRLESNSMREDTISHDILTYQKYITKEESFALYDSLTTDDIKIAAVQTFIPEKMSFGIISSNPEISIKREDLIEEMKAGEKQKSGAGTTIDACNIESLFLSQSKV